MSGPVSTETSSALLSTGRPYNTPSTLFSNADRNASSLQKQPTMLCNVGSRLYSLPFCWPLEHGRKHSEIGSQIVYKSR